MKLLNAVHRVARKCKSVVFDVRTKHCSLSTAELFFQHNKEYGFLRYDIIVRLLAIENYYGLNEYGFDLYYKMQKARNGKNHADKAVGFFKFLIESYEKDGYDEKSEIELDANLNLIDGSHRMALAFYYKIPTISVKIRPYVTDILYGMEWFRINGFSDNECEILKDKYQEIRSQYITSFICTLWHPAREFFDEITQNLALFGRIKEIKDFNLSKWDYEFYTRGIYAVDDIEKWKIEKKLEYMQSLGTETYQLRMISLEINDPMFRLKSNRKTLSRRCEQIKKQIRDAYMHKIDGYFYDIIMHIGDNFYQNRCIYQLLNMPPIDVKLILEHIQGYNYVITKLDSPYIPKDFPVHYPLGKDIDIICADKEEYNKILGTVENDVKMYETSYHIRQVKYNDQDNHEYRSLIRLEQEGHVLVLQFDISCKIGGLSPDFLNEMIEARKKNNVFYIPSIEYELICRLNEICNTKNKRHHIDFVREHINELDHTLCERFMNKRARNTLKEILLFDDMYNQCMKKLNQEASGTLCNSGGGNFYLTLALYYDKARSVFNSFFDYKETECGRNYVGIIDNFEYFNLRIIKREGRLLPSMNNSNPLLLHELTEKDFFPISDFSHTEHLDKMLDELRSVCFQNNIALDKICVVGSSIMALYGMRDNQDVDFVVTPDIRKRYSKKVYKFGNHIEMVSENWARSLSRDTITDEELISSPKNHILYQGIKFATIPLLYQRKKYQNRVKDIDDLIDMMLLKQLKIINI